MAGRIVPETRQLTLEELTKVFERPFHEHMKRGVKQAQYFFTGRWREIRQLSEKNAHVEGVQRTHGGDDEA